MNIIEKSKTLMLAMGATPIMYLLIGLSIASFAIVARTPVVLLSNQRST